MSKEKQGTKAIAQRNRLMLAYLDLIRDRTFRKLSEPEKTRLIDEVLNIGEEAARWVKTEYGSDDPRKIAVKMGLRILGEEQKKLKRSEYRHDRKEIAISRRFHEKLLKEIDSRELSDRLLKLVVAHELFHHLERERIGEVYKRYRFPVWCLGPLVRERYIKGLSEVAARAFTQNLLGLELSPQVFDYLLLAAF